MSKQITLTYCGIEATGETVTEAKKQAAATLTKLVKDLDRDPVIVRCGEYAKLVWRDARGWQSALIASPDRELGSKEFCGAYGHDDREEAIQRAIYHVVQCAWSPEVFDDQSFCELNGLKGRELSDLVSWCKWQRRYAEARFNGATDAEAHEIACGLRPAA